MNIHRIWHLATIQFMAGHSGPLQIYFENNRPEYGKYYVILEDDHGPALGMMDSFLDRTFQTSDYSLDDHQCFFGKVSIFIGRDPVEEYENFDAFKEALGIKEEADPPAPGAPGK